MSESRAPGRVRRGDPIGATRIETLSGTRVTLDDGRGWTHLQMRRFAGCPVCNLHLREFALRHPELRGIGVRVVAVFHSEPAALKEYQDGLPFELVADPTRSLYRQFGVETGLRSVIDPAAWPAMLAGLRSGRWGLPAWGESSFGKPADLLVAADGRAVEVKYGRHADDHWSVDDVLAFAAQHGKSAPAEKAGPLH